MMKGSDIARHCLILEKKRFGHNRFNTHKNAYASFGKTGMARTKDTESSCSDSRKCKKVLRKGNQNHKKEIQRYLHSQ